MSDSNRGERSSVRLAIAIAAAITAIALASLAVLYGLNEVSKYEWEASEKYREYTAYTYGPKRNSCLKLPILTQPDCVANAAREAREYERQEQDLVSQRVTAIWTMLMGGAAITGMLLSVLGVYLVWTTFKATKDGNDIAREMGRAQTRAWVSYDNIVTHIDTSNQSIAVSLKFVWSNSGSTPALNTNIKWFKFVAPMEFNFDDFPSAQIPEDSVNDNAPIGPQKTTYSGAMPLTAEDISTIVNKRGRVFFVSEIIYETIFPTAGGPRKSAACVEMDIVGIGPGQTYTDQQLSSAFNIKIVGPLNFVT